MSWKYNLREALPALYADYGCEIRNAPDIGPLDQCMALYQSNCRIDTGLGCTWADIEVWEKLAKTFTPRAIFGIGNGFGWSTLALRLIWQDAALLVMDAGIEGGDNAAATTLTVTILGKMPDRPLGAVVCGTSPVAVPWGMLVLGAAPALVFIDGFHSNDQQTADFEAVRPFLAADHIVFFHDVMWSKLEESWAGIARQYPGRSRILDTPTGMGCVWTGDIGEGLR